MEKPKRRVRSYPRSRLATVDVGRIAGSKHSIAALLEVDVTQARRAVRARLRAGGDASIMAWVVRAAALAVERHPEVTAVNTHRRRQVIFEDVDIALPLERTVEGSKVPITAMVRRAQAKDIGEIAREIRAAAERTITGPEDYVPAERSRRRAESLFFFMPALLRRAIWRILMRSPDSVKRNMGSLVVTNVGISGRTSAWLLPKTMHNLSIAVGSITKKPRVVRGEVAVRDVMNLTILFDHDVVDGAPAARFVDTLVALMESAADLGDTAVSE